MARAKRGDTVKVHYTGTLSGGGEFDSSAGRAPLEFTIGGGDLIPGFEDAVVGMAPGESRSVVIPAEEAYGPRHAAGVEQVERTRIPAEIELAAGIRLEGRDQTGRRVVLTVTEVTEATVTLDANHPLAGEDLTFEIELIEIA